MSGYLEYNEATKISWRRVLPGKALLRDTLVYKVAKP